MADRDRLASLAVELHATALHIPERETARDIKLLFRFVKIGEVEKRLSSDTDQQKQALIAEFGSPGRIRTGDLSINSRMLYR